MEPLAIGACSWSINREDPCAAITAAKRDLKVNVVQVGFLEEHVLDAADPAAIRAVAEESGVSLCGTFIGFDGLDRTSIATVGRTGGLVPDDLFEHRLEVLKRGAEITQALGLDQCAAHLGLVPSDPSSDAFRVLLERVARAAKTAKTMGVTLLAETGQESADVLKAFLEELKKRTPTAPIGINFDPANFVIQATGDPVKSATTLADQVTLVHLKDAENSSDPGVAWGNETALGTGNADIPRVISRLRARGYTGPLLVERRLADSDLRPFVEDIEYVQSMLM